MKSAQEILEEILAISNPNQACLKLVESTQKENLPLDELEKILEAYLKKYNIDLDDMVSYPNGEMVITLEVYWSFQEDGTIEGTPVSG